MITVNATVRYIEPFDDEVGTTYRVLEVNDDRVLMVALMGLPINPTYTAPIDEIEEVTI